MAKAREIKRRIRSIGSILQVTRAMELISSIKMKKAQTAALRSKDYVFEAWRAVLAIANLEENKNHPLLAERGKGRILALVVSSDRGLAGSYNSDILRATVKFVGENDIGEIDFIVLGEKAKKFIRKIGGNIIATFPLGEEKNFTLTSPIVRVAWEGWEKKKYRRFVTIHTHFESAGRKEATSLQILPFSKPEHIELPSEVELTKYEPSHQEVISTVGRQIVRGLVLQIISESEAAEHAARMIAMKNATDAAGELKEDFEFTYNQIRQQGITAELAEISAGAIAQE